MAYRTSLRIAGLGIKLETEIPIRINESFVPFLEDANCGKTEGDYRVFFQETDRLEVPKGKEAVRTRDFTVYERSPGHYLRVYHDGRDFVPYGTSEFYQEEHRVEIRYLPEAEKYFSEAGNSFFHIEWENLLIRKQRMLLHAACVRQEETGGILFAGPSGAGKSTQAELWRRYLGASVINGDRTILCRSTEGWRGWGSPYAGSSRVYVNECFSVDGLVFVKQAPEFGLRRLKPVEAFQRIYEELTINSWDRSFVHAACGLTETLIREVPVWEMTCTRERRTAELLYRELRRERADGK